jgi:hypothetical protein
MEFCTERLERAADVLGAFRSQEAGVDSYQTPAGPIGEIIVHKLSKCCMQFVSIHCNWWILMKLTFVFLTYQFCAVWREIRCKMEQKTSS